MSDGDNASRPTLLNMAFSTHLQQYSYSPPSKRTLASTNEEEDGLTVQRGNESAPLAPSSSSKRKLSISSSITASSQSFTPAKRRTTTKQRSANDPYEPENNLVDSLRPGLILIFIGLNPGLETARTGHAYAHPTNHFWPLLHNSGITPVRHKASDTHALPELYNIGNTNLCARATRSGDGLSKAEQVEGAKIVEAKIAKYKPEAVCIVGKGIWDVIYKAKTGKTLKRADFKYGWQDVGLWLGRKMSGKGEERWGGARTFVCTSTSGLAADTKPAEKLAILKELGIG